MPKQLTPEHKAKRMESALTTVVHLSLHHKKFLSGQHQYFQNDREVEMSVTVVPIPGADFCDRGYKSWSHGMTNVSIPEVNMLKKNSIPVSVPINLFSKLDFVCVNGLKETYFVDALRNKSHLGKKRATSAKKNISGTLAIKAIKEASKVNF